ncbi:MAG TPA: aminotransferase class I/II-fold pyridoxal phosphate-dependent enzyme, partial [Candidatus Omnitrophota bacterium]|nr:aminotransferase class I/II-fold pyridoxal phosphate-dependent enzyme [Candidatus Omnitrophota bacterium]
PLDQIVELAQKYDTIVMIDEAHAVGILGEKGTGAAEYFGLDKKIDIQMGTLSKAAGVFGAYCCGSKSLIDFLINCARSFIYTTGLPPFVAACARRAIEIIEEEPHRRTRLAKHSEYMRRELNRMGFDTLESQTPIIPILVKDPNRAVEFSRKLFESGIFVQAIRPPTVPMNTARLRLTVMATHQQNDLDFVLEEFQQTGKELCLI